MKPSLSHPLLGAHMSIAGGAVNALTSGESIGCTAIQIFTASNRQWSTNLLHEDDVLSFLEHKKKSPIQIVMSHCSYLINIGSSDHAVGQKSIIALKAELLRCEQLHLPFAVLHPGSYKNGETTDCMDRIIKGLNTVLEDAPGKCMILLENSAGQGSSVGTTFEELAYLRHGVHHKKRIGFCIDTCHAFAAGYNYLNPQDYHAMWKKFDDILGLENLKAMHLNDSKKGLGSRVDRHEHIGHGAIGKEGFSLIMNDKKLAEIPKILETPKEKDLKDDVRNLEFLRSLIG